MTEELRAIRQSSETARNGNRNTQAQITKKSVKLVGSASNNDESDNGSHFARCFIINDAADVSFNNSLKAAKPLIKKAIYCVQNIDGATTTEDMTQFVTSLGVRVESCFEAKTRFEDTKAFRVCINSDDNDVFLDANNWPSDVILRQWTFKGKLSNVASQAAAAVSTAGANSSNTKSTGGRTSITEPIGSGSGNG